MDLRISDVTIRLSCSFNKVKEMCESGFFPGAYQLPGQVKSAWRIPEEGLEAFRKKRAAVSVPPEEEKAVSAPAPPGKKERVHILKRKTLYEDEVPMCKNYCDSIPKGRKPDGCSTGGYGMSFREKNHE